MLVRSRFREEGDTSLTAGAAAVDTSRQCHSRYQGVHRTNRKRQRQPQRPAIIPVTKSNNATQSNSGDR